MAVTFGLLGFWVNCHALTFLSLAQSRLIVLIGLLFPLLIALAWGWRYALLAVLVGGGQALWWLCLSGGCNVFHAVPGFALWVVWHGYWAGYRRGHEPRRWYVSMYAVEAVFRIAGVLVGRVALGWAVDVGAPPFAAAAMECFSHPWTHLPIIQHTIAAYAMLLACDVLLRVKPVRSLLASDRQGKRGWATQAVVISVLTGLGLGVVHAVVACCAFVRDEGLQLDRMVLHIPPSSLLVSDLFLGTCVAGGVLIGAALSRLQQAGEALRRREASTAAILTAARNVAFVTTDLAGADARIVEFSPGAEHIFGYSRDEIIGRCAAVLHTPEDAARFPQTIAALRRRKKGISAEVTLVRKSGEAFPALFSVHPILDGQGELVGVLGVSVDITERKRAEEYQRFQTILLDQIGDCVTATDLEGRITYVNAAECSHTNRSREELVGRTVEVYGEDADRGPTQRDIVAATLAEGQWRGEVVNFTRDGERLIMDSRTWVLRDEDGKATGLCGTATDITERKRMEEALRESEEKFRTFMETASDLMQIVDSEGRFTYVNEATVRTLGYTRREMLRMHLDEVTGGETPGGLGPWLTESIERGQISREAVLVTKDGRRVRGDVKAVAAYDGEGKFVGCRSVFRDMTERVRAERERRLLEARVQHAQKLESLGVLAGGIAHDFNNLLASVLGNTDLALADMPEDAPPRRFIEESRRAVIQASELTNQMLAYSGKGQFDVRVVSLNEVVAEMGALMSVSISKKVEMKYDLAADLPNVEVDVSQIRQVVMNLITNASEAIGDDNGVVTIRTSLVQAERQDLVDAYRPDENPPPGPYVCLEVADSGCGMDDRAKARLFDPFHTTKFTGRGLGLAAVLGIVRGHRGAIRVDSRVGEGSVFRVFLPASKRPAAPPLEGLGSDAPPWRGQGTVLIADDEPGVRNVAEAILVRNGLDVLIARDGREAVEAFRDNADRIDLILLDMTMPHVGGAEALAEIRRIRADAKVILMSGYSEQEAAAGLVGKGLAGFIQKPFALDELLNTVRAVLTR